MSNYFEQEEPRVISPWISGHQRPSKPLPTGWSEAPAGTWHKDGWSVVVCSVQSCLPKSTSHHVLYRVFPPGETQHRGSFTVLARAKGWAEGKAREQHGGKQEN